MAMQSYKKLRMFYILDFLKNRTDRNHGITLKEISESLLNEYGIEADRRSIYDDIHALREYGFEIDRMGHDVRYYLCSREFSAAELRLLMDAVQSSRFITIEKSNELISKLKKMCSSYEARALARTVHVQNRIKSMNDSIYLNIDSISDAINENRMISFKYFNWSSEKTRVLRNGGKPYIISPFALTWTDENYYLIGYSESANQLRHFRVDKMLSITVLDEPRKGHAVFDRADMASYTSSVFGMFGGEVESVIIEFEESLSGVIIDRFGDEPEFFPAGNGKIRARVRAVPSPQFYGWILGLGDGIKITGPEKTAADFRKYLESINNLYK